LDIISEFLSPAKHSSASLAYTEVPYDSDSDASDTPSRKLKSAQENGEQFSMIQEKGIARLALYARQLMITRNPRLWSFHLRSDITYGPKLIANLILFVGVAFECQDLRLLVDLYTILPCFKRITSWRTSTHKSHNTLVDI
jgi:hypothetical protein